MWYRYSQNNTIDAFWANKDGYLDEANSYVELMDSQPNRSPGAIQRINRLINVFSSWAKNIGPTHSYYPYLMDDIEQLKTDIQDINQKISAPQQAQEEAQPAQQPAPAQPQQRPNIPDHYGPGYPVPNTAPAVTQPVSNEDKIRNSLTVTHGRTNDQIIVNSSLYNMPMTLQLGQALPAGEIQRNIQDEAKNQYLNRNKNLLLRFLQQDQAKQATPQAA